MFNLKNVLLINGGSSAATGLLIAAIPGTVAGIFGMQNTTVFVGVGIFLLIFSTIVLLTGVQKQAKASMVKLIIALDITWVVLSILVVVLQPNLTTIGYALILAVAAWVALMAFLQKKNLKEAVY